MTVLLVLHGVVALACPVLLGTRAGARLDRGVFVLAALPPAAAAVWAATRLPEVLDGGEPVESVGWVGALDLQHVVRLDALALVMTLLVGGVGAVVALYCTRYFHPGEHGLGRFAGLLVAFAAAMLGLVTADDLRLLYVYWEATSVLSFLLVAHHDEEATSRGAALQALLVTTLGGLVMLGGFVLLGESAGTYRVGELVASPPEASAATAVAVVCVLVGVATKSAQVPFHPWLPAAMAAPTPVSAYLHAAAMVKAGVYLVARLAPGLVDLPPWRPAVLALGGATMLLGGWRALRQHDLKRLLAFGTISQLGFLVLLAGAGTRIAALAAVGVLVAHALSKAALFLAVGVVDERCHTRDLRELSGVGRLSPLLAGATGLAALSYAALPPMLGFVGKETGLEAFWEPAAEEGAVGDAVVLAVVVAGACMTVAYTLRFWFGTFGDFGTTPGTQPQPQEHRPETSFVAPVVLLAALGLLLGLVPGLLDPLAAAYADGVEAPGEDPYHLELWHGLTPVLGLSLLSIAVGAALFRASDTVHRVQHATPTVGDADAAYRSSLARVDAGSARLTGLVQSGSLPVYLSTVLVTLVVVVAPVLVVATDVSADSVHLFDDWAQPVVAVAVAVAAVLTAKAHRRFTAILFAGAVGYGVALLFALQGAPDLALTQFLVETLSVVVFVLVLRRLPRNFTRRPLQASQALRAAVGAAVGLLMATFVVVSGAGRQSESIADLFVRATPDTGGSNVVNVILVEFRAFDTLGEVAVLVLAAVGIAVLVTPGRGEEQAPAVSGGPDALPADAGPHAGDGAPGGSGPSGHGLDGASGREQPASASSDGRSGSVPASSVRGSTS